MFYIFFYYWYIKSLNDDSEYSNEADCMKINVTKVDDVYHGYRKITAKYFNKNN